MVGDESWIRDVQAAAVTLISFTDTSLLLAQEDFMCLDV